MAAGGPDPGPAAGADGPRRRAAGSWILPDERPRPAELAAFVDAGTPSCTWVPAACPCAPGRTSPGWRSRRSARRAAVCSSPQGWADPGPDRRPGWLLRRRRGQPPGTVRPGGLRRVPRKKSPAFCSKFAATPENRRFRDRNGPLQRSKNRTCVLSQRSKLVAEVHGSRTHPRTGSCPSNRFEDGEAHRDPSTSRYANAVIFVPRVGDPAGGQGNPPGTCRSIDSSRRERRSVLSEWSSAG